MNAFLLEYLPIVIFLGIAAVLGLGFMLAAWVLAPKNPDSEKLSEVTTTHAVSVPDCELERALKMVRHLRS